MLPLIVAAGSVIKRPNNLSHFADLGVIPLYCKVYYHFYFYSLAFTVKEENEKPPQVLTIIKLGACFNCSRGSHWKLEQSPQEYLQEMECRILHPSPPPFYLLLKQYLSS